MNNLLIMGEDNQNQTGIATSQSTPQPENSPSAPPVESVGAESTTQPQTTEPSNPTPQQQVGQETQPTSVVQPAKKEGFLGKIAKLFKR